MVKLLFYLTVNAAKEQRRKHQGPTRTSAMPQTHISKKRKIAKQMCHKRHWEGK
jgi:hypothetical protein